MSKRVLVPMDHSEMAKKALRYALDVHSDGDITVLHVAGEPSSMMGKAVSIALADDIDEAAEESAREIFETARDIATEYDTEITTKVKLGHPTRAILNQADEYDAIVLGAHGGSLSDRLIVGNVAEKVFRRSPVPVTVVR